MSNQDPLEHKHAALGEYILSGTIQGACIIPQTHTHTQTHTSIFKIMFSPNIVLTLFPSKLLSTSLA